MLSQGQDVVGTGRRDSAIDCSLGPSLEPCEGKEVHVWESGRALEGAT